MALLYVMLSPAASTAAPPTPTGRVSTVGSSPSSRIARYFVGPWVAEADEPTPAPRPQRKPDEAAPAPPQKKPDEEQPRPQRKPDGEAPAPRPQQKPDEEQPRPQRKPDEEAPAPRPQRKPVEDPAAPRTPKNSEETPVEPVRRPSKPDGVPTARPQRTPITSPSIEVPSGKPFSLPGCTHDVTFQKLDSSSATAIRVTPYSGGAHLQNAAAPTGWSVSSSASGAVFTRTSGGVIPQGSYPGFLITVSSNNSGQQYVLVEWLNAAGKTICGQPLFVPCGGTGPRSGQEAAVAAPPPYGGPSCGCLNAHTGADDTSDILDADVDVTVGPITSAGFLKFKVPYTVELDPVTLPINKNWQVITYDETGNEVVVPLQPTSDSYSPQTGQGQAIFTVPQGGDFDVTLSVASKLTCLNNPEVSRDMAADEDSAGYRAADIPSVIEATPADPCDPFKYVFTDITEPVGDNPIWTVAQAGYAPQTVAPDGNGAYSFRFPTGNVTYNVCLVADDPTTHVQRPVQCVQVTPAPGAVDVKFTWKDYDCCVLKNFVVKFKNKTKNIECPVTWKWDFGDNTPTSSDENPTHTYVNPGTYTVTLDANGSQTSKTITIAHWEPTIAPPVDCGDGSVVWSTQDGATIFDRKWTPSGGDYSIFKRRFKKLRVCYSAPGLYSMTLWARNADGGTCSVTRRIQIDKIVRCCRRDKTSSVDMFNVDGKQYRVRTKFRYRGFVGRLFAKTKLQVLKNGIWRRKKADSISVSMSGSVYSKSGDCLCVDAHTIPPSGDTKSKRAKVSRYVMPGVGTFRVKQGGLTSTHSVTIGGHTETKTLKLWINDCGCSWKN